MTFNDLIGNRSWTKAGGDSSGSNLRLFDYGYGLNVLNQSLGRSVPGALDVMGMANGSASVTVNGQGAYRRNEYYQALVSVNNASGPVWQSVSVNASLEGSNQGQSGNAFVPRTPESFVYDAAGNLGRDGRWTNTWNGANQLVKSEAMSEVPAAAKRKVEFEYDQLGRRTGKKVYDWDTGVSGYVLGLQRKFVYDGWNVIAELDGSDTVLRTYVWALDLSGTLQGAGGVGGLVAVKPAGGTAHFAAMDGNGNVVGLLDGGSGIVSASYEYGPFGEPIRVTGTLGKANPFRWSTKYTDDETDLVYYGHRYFNPSTGRWLSRDPIGEQGGPSLYAFVNNSPVNEIDVLGLFLSGTHRRLTRQSLDRSIESAGLKLTATCREKVFKALADANTGQDSGDAFDALERHFNRPYVGNETGNGLRSARETWDGRYRAYLTSEAQAFGQQLSASPPGCLGAIEALGRLTHSWQDFYAHAISSAFVSRWQMFVRFDAWTYGFGGTPDQHPQLWPSSYNSPTALAEGEHPNLGEPVHGSEALAREAAAVSFAATKYAGFLKQWIEQCSCWCDSK